MQPEVCGISEVCMGLVDGKAPIPQPKDVPIPPRPYEENINILITDKIFSNYSLLLFVL